MNRPIRVKLCDRCQHSAPVLYRVKIEPEGDWLFVCTPCWPSVSQNNPQYVYGGTWKAKKKRR